MKEISISVGSATQYENLIAEIKFGSVAGIIVSKEPSDTEYMVSLHSFNGDAAHSFDYNLNVPSDKLSLSHVVYAIAEAVTRLEKLNEGGREAPDSS